MGVLIAIDGLDGSGKHTQFDLISDALTARGIKVRRLEFPVYSSESSQLVRMYLDGRLGSSPDDTNAYAASMFFAADRYVSFVTDWRADRLDPDTVLVADRYTTANAIHQLSKLPRHEWDVFLSWLSDFEYGKLGLPSPDLVLFLELPPEVSLSLVESRSRDTGRKLDIHEQDHGFILKSYEAGQYAKTALGWQTVVCYEGGAVRTREDILSECMTHVDGLLARLNKN